MSIRRLEIGVLLVFQNVDSSVHLPESMVFYLSTIKGCHDDRIETELQDCNEALERTNIHSNLTDNLMERMKNELGDQFSEEEILMSRQVWSGFGVLEIGGNGNGELCLLGY